KSVAGAVGIGSGEGYGALNVAGVCTDGRIHFVTLGKDGQDAELDGVVAKNEGGIIAGTVVGIGMMPGSIAGVGRESLTAVGEIRSGENDPGQLVAEGDTINVRGRGAKKIADASYCATRARSTGGLRQGRIVRAIQTGDAGASNRGKEQVVGAVGHSQVVNQISAEGAGEVR